MRQELQGFLLIGASLGAFNLAVVAGAPGAAQAQSRTAGQVFRDCANVCPEMVVVPQGSFTMGSQDVFDAVPQRTVTVARPFAVGRFEVTFAEWDACVAAGGCPRADLSKAFAPDDFEKAEGAGYDNGWGRERRPVINVSWQDATLYVQWLSSRTGQRYRLLSEAEWEYSARAGTTTPYSTGRSISADDANFREAGQGRTVPVGSFTPNAFGLHDMHGNVWEWVEDCFNETYSGAPVDGSAWTQGDCSRRMARGGGWENYRESLSSAFRFGDSSSMRWFTFGFRVARTL